MITQEELKEVLHYDPETGVFTWHKGKQGRRKDLIAGGPRRDGYHEVRIGDHRVLMHRLAWLYVHGTNPTDFIDHINGIRNDNRIANLREATGSQNAANAKVRKDNTSGYKGVSWHDLTKKWKAHIQINNKPKYIGIYDTKEEAYEAYKDASTEYNGEFARFE